MALSPDLFDGLVVLLQENLRIVGSDVGRLAEQHRLEIERLGRRQSAPLGEEGPEALRLLQPRLAADVGVDVELPPQEFQRLRASFDDEGVPKPAAAVPSTQQQEEEEEPKPPPRPSQEQPAPPQAEAQLLEHWLDTPGCVREDCSEDVPAGLTGVVPVGLPVPSGVSTCVATEDPPPLLSDVAADTGNFLSVAGKAKGHGHQKAGQKAARPSLASLGLKAPRPSLTSSQEADDATLPPDAGSAPGSRRGSHRDVGEEVNRHQLREKLRLSQRLSSGSNVSAGAEERPSRTSERRLSSYLPSTFQVRRGCVPDAVELKEQVRRAIAKPPQTVASLYHDEGLFQAIARSPLFDVVTLLVTFLNAVWIGIEMDGNTSVILIEADAVFQVGEHFFCLYFFGEWLVRFCAFRRKRDCHRDTWFLFDSLLALLLVFDTWIMTLVAVVMGNRGRSLNSGDASLLRMLKIVRLVRLTRMSKLLWAFPELLVVIRGIGVAVRTVFFTLCLQIFVVYVFSVCFKRLTENSGSATKLFPGVYQGMKILILQGILPDFAPLIEQLGDAGPFLGIVAIIFTLLASITIMNFIVGVLVEVVKVTSTVEREHLQATYVKRHLNEMLKELGVIVDEEDDPRIAPSDFEFILLHPRTASYMQDMGVDVVGLVDFFDVIFRDGQDFPLSDFFHLVLSLRGSNPTTVKDIVDLRSFFIVEIRDLEESLLRQIADMRPLSSLKMSGSNPAG